MIKILETRVNKRTRYAWYTPDYVLEAVREVLGEIDLDPCTDEDAQTYIKAKNYYTWSDNGIDKRWEGAVWCNPPYSDPEWNQFLKAAYDEWLAGHMAACILVTHTQKSHDTDFINLLDVSDAVCIAEGEIKWRASNPMCHFQPFENRGNIFFYLGAERDKFRDVFRKFGVIKYAV